MVLAVFGGYVGLGLAGQARRAAGFHRRGLLAGAAWSLGLGIWTMHFVGILAAQLPDGTLFSVLLMKCQINVSRETLAERIVFR